MYVGIEFFVGLFLGVALYFHVGKWIFESLRKAIHNMKINSKREKAMQDLIDMDEYLHTGEK